MDDTTLKFRMLFIKYSQINYCKGSKSVTYLVNDVVTKNGRKAMFKWH